ncbi:hypothetical protein ES332_A05G326400v1, partial [Gossypium tomentosum]
MMNPKCNNKRHYITSASSLDLKLNHRGSNDNKERHQTFGLKLKHTHTFNNPKENTTNNHHHHGSAKMRKLVLEPRGIHKSYKQKINETESCFLRTRILLLKNKSFPHFPNSHFPLRRSSSFFFIHPGAFSFAYNRYHPCVVLHLLIQ